MHRATCGRDGEPCPTGEHGWCSGCRDEVLVTAPATQHDDGCPAVTEPATAEPSGRPFDYLTDRSLFDTIARVLQNPNPFAAEYLPALINECHVRAMIEDSAREKADPVTGMTLAEIEQEIVNVRSALNGYTGPLSDTQRACDTAWLSRLTTEAIVRRAIDDDADKELLEALGFLVSVGIDTGEKYEKALQFHGL
jgi:hypothetical protein